jgi:hypothetical protein
MTRQIPVPRQTENRSGQRVWVAEDVQWEILLSLTRIEALLARLVEQAENRAAGHLGTY